MCGMLSRETEAKHIFIVCRSIFRFLRRTLNYRMIGFFDQKNKPEMF